MTTWRANSPKTRPPYQTPCLIRTRDGNEYRAELIHLNLKYHKTVTELDKWRVAKHKYIDNADVVEWRYDLDI